MRIVRLLLALLIPDQLTAHLYRLTPAEAHWLAARLGVTEGMHSWLGLCVPGCTEIDCEVELALDADHERMAADELALAT